METNNKTVLDYCSDITLHNNQVLVYVEGTVSTLQLNTLSAEKGSANSAIVDKFFKELAKSDKIIAMVSDKVAVDYPKAIVGDKVVFNAYGNPNAIFIESDPCELDNVIDNFKHDKKDNAFNTIGINYKVRCYYTYEATSIILTIKK